jgi:thiamine-monophosphate kinase
MDEFDIIDRYFAPLAAENQNALGLTDDAALVHPPTGHELVIAKDAIVQGVHFIGDETPADIARKLLRVNLSDMAAMGAKPYGYLLALMLPSSTDNTWFASFARGLREDQKRYGITLLGGDTTHTQGELCLSATMLGWTPVGAALKRRGAKAGDDLYVSGTIGDGALGVRVARGEPRIASRESRNYLLQRYRLPEPRVMLGQRLKGIATSCMDISDGLVQDLGHICECSHVGAKIDFPLIPLSQAARAVLPKIQSPYETVLAGGDDYELLFTAPPEAAKALSALARKLDIRIGRIGSIVKGNRIKVMNEQGKMLILKRRGYSHF